MHRAFWSGKEFLKLAGGRGVFGNKGNLLGTVLEKFGLPSSQLMTYL